MQDTESLESMGFKQRSFSRSNPLKPITYMIGGTALVADLLGIKYKINDTGTVNELHEAVKAFGVVTTTLTAFLNLFVSSPSSAKTYEATIDLSSYLNATKP